MVNKVAPKVNKRSKNVQVFSVYQFMKKYTCPKFNRLNAFFFASAQPKPK